MRARHARLTLTVVMTCAATGARAQAPESFVSRLVAAALEQTTHAVTYDGSYRRIPYPGGDVPATIGVCTDVVIRSYRALGIDLQQRVHEDMRASFAAYPRHWGGRAPDTNIDHRRVPNLQTFFRRAGAAVAVTRDPADYRPDQRDSFFQEALEPSFTDAAKKIREAWGAYPHRDHFDVIDQK